MADGFDPVRHRLGVAYEDDCLRLGLTWRRDYPDTGDARRGNSFLLTLAFKNLGAKPRFSLTWRAWAMQMHSHASMRAVLKNMSNSPRARIALGVAGLLLAGTAIAQTADAPQDNVPPPTNLNLPDNPTDLRQERSQRPQADRDRQRRA